MPSHRTLRVAEAIREVVSSTILFELNDPRVRGITVLGAEVTGDLRHATVFVSVMGTETERKLALKGLNHATGFLQSKVASRLQTRFTPALTFKADDSVKKSIAMSKLIDETLGRDPNPPVPEPTDAEDDAGPETQVEPEVGPDAETGGPPPS